MLRPARRAVAAALRQRRMPAVRRAEADGRTPAHDRAAQQAAGQGHVERAAADEPGVGNQRQMTADCASVHTELHNQ